MSSALHLFLKSVLSFYKIGYIQPRVTEIHVSESRKVKSRKLYVVDNHFSSNTINTVITVKITKYHVTNINITMNCDVSFGNEDNSSRKSKIFWYQTVFLHVIICLIHEVSPFVICWKWPLTVQCHFTNKSLVMWGLLWGLWIGLIDVLTGALPAIITKCWGQRKWMEGNPWLS